MAPVTSDISTPGSGTYTTGAAQVPGTPTHVGSATNQISITFTTGTNGTAVTYLINVEKDGGDVGYVQADGTIAAGEIWRTIAAWGSIINVTGLTGVHSYRFKAKARNEVLTETVYSSFSTTMMPMLDLVYSPLSNSVTYECTTGNVKISGLAVTAVGNSSPGVYTIAYTLTRINTPATKANVKIAYGGETTLTSAATSGTNTIVVTTVTGFINGATIYIELDDGTYQTTTINGAPSGTTVTLTDNLTDDCAAGNTVTAYTNLTDTVTAFGDNTSRFDMTISSPVYSTTYTYDGTGTAPLFVSNGLVAGMMVTISSSTFASGNNGIFRVIAVAETYITVENSSGVAETNKVLSANTSITSCVSIGGAISGLTASVSGTVNSNKWASCKTVGNSYANTIYIRVTPYDETTGGNAGASTSTSVSVDNRPLSVTLSELDGYTWDSDTTPEFIANMESVVCGSYLYFCIHIYNSTGTEIQTLSSSEILDGWYYEQDHAGSPGTWTAMTYLGVSTIYAPPAITGNRVKYELQTALTPSATYSCKMQQAEIREELI